MDVVDISSHQGNVTVGMFNTMKKYGVKMIIVKLSEGNYYRNPYAAEQIANARAAGLRVGGLTTTLRIQRQAKPLLKQIILLIQHKALA
ncbi:GH25 family lysozyme [Weissella confusa]|nr:GH25 family lysozyme [Weissella confusa]